MQYIIKMLTQQYPSHSHSQSSSSRISSTSRNRYFNKYQSTTSSFKYNNPNNDRYIPTLTRQQASEHITAYPFLYEIYKKNKPHIQWQLLDQLMKVPSQSDGPGFIYGFMNQQENGLLQAPYWIKIGRTKQNPPQMRIFQWEKDDDCQITEIFTVRSLYNKKLQALVHLLFAYARENRVINGHKRIQWFRFQEITLTAAAVNILNHVMNVVHTTKMDNKPKQYLNRTLKQLTQKLQLTNINLQQISSLPHVQTIQNFIRDLGIQIGNNDKIKYKLSQCKNINQAVQIMVKQGGGYAVGKQIQLFMQQMEQFQNIGKYMLERVQNYRNYTIKCIKQLYDNTRIPTQSSNKPVQDKSVLTDKSKYKQSQQSQITKTSPIRNKNNNENENKQSISPFSKNKKQSDIKLDNSYIKQPENNTNIDTNTNISMVKQKKKRKAPTKKNKDNKIKNTNVSMYQYGHAQNTQNSIYESKLDLNNNNNNNTSVLHNIYAEQSKLAHFGNGNKNSNTSNIYDNQNNNRIQGKYKERRETQRSKSKSKSRGKVTQQYKSIQKQKQISKQNGKYKQKHEQLQKTATSKIEQSSYTYAIQQNTDTSNYNNYGQYYPNPYKYQQYQQNYYNCYNQNMETQAFNNSGSTYINNNPNLNIISNDNINNNNICVKQKQTKLQVLVYDSQGQLQRKQNMEINMKQIAQFNATLSKYRTNNNNNNNNKKQQQQQQSLSQLRLSQQHYNSYDNDNSGLLDVSYNNGDISYLNQTKTQQQLQEQLQAMNVNTNNDNTNTNKNSNNSSNEVITMQVDSFKEFLSSKHWNANNRYILFSQLFKFDIQHLKLDAVYLIFAKRLVIVNPCKISKVKKSKTNTKTNTNTNINSVKGFIKCYSYCIQNQSMLQLDKGCDKYVGLYQISKNGKYIIALDQYHKNKSDVDQADKQMAERLKQFYPI